MPIHKFGNCMFGVDFSIPPHLLPRGFLADAKNIVPTASGLPRGRNGSVKLNSTAMASRITSLHEFRSGTTRSTLCSYGTVIALYSSATGEFTSEITGLTTGKHLQWVNFAGKSICVNEGADAPQYFTDASTHGALAGSWPNGLTVTEWANRLWIGGDSTNVALLTGSQLNDPTSKAISSPMVATDGVSQTVGDGKEKITGLFGFFDILLVGKKNALYKVTGTPTTNVTTLSIVPVYSKNSDSVGFTSQWAITQVGNDVLFLDGYDIKALSGIQAYGDVETTSVIPHVKDFLKDTVDKTNLQYTQFFHYKKMQQVWVSIPMSATTHYVFILDYRFKEATKRYSFYPLGELPIVCLAGIENGELQDIYAGFEDGWVRQLDINNDDDGAAIDRYFVTVTAGNDFDNGIDTGHEMRKQFQRVEAAIKPDGTLSMTPYYALDLMDDAQVRTSGNYTALSAETVSGWSGTGTKNKRIRLFGLNGKSLALKWRHNTVGQNFTFYPSGIHFDWKTANGMV